VPEEASGEAYIPAECSEASEAPRVSVADVDPSRPSGAAGPPAQGPRPPVGLTGRVGRVRGRRAFAALRHDGRRARRGPVTVTYRAEPSGTLACVAWSVSRRVGTAVTRNRVRRRLRAAFVATAGVPDGPVQPGAYLVSVTPAATELSYEALAGYLRTCLIAVAPAPRTPSAMGRPQ
jgi:ribonuclease P protein component